MRPDCRASNPSSALIFFSSAKSPLPPLSEPAVEAEEDDFGVDRVVEDAAGRSPRRGVPERVVEVEHDRGVDPECSNSRIRCGSDVMSCGARPSMTARG